MVRPWTIKVGPDIRNAATEAAKREGQEIGEWIARAVLSQIQSDLRREVAVTPAPETVRLEPVRPEVGLADVERIVGLVGQMAEAGAPPPKGVSRLVYSLLRGRLADIRGPTQRRESRTIEAPGRTLAVESQTNTQPAPSSPQDNHAG